MSKRLKIADDLLLPIDAVTQTFGILSVRGAGKTNTAAVMAEEMFKADLPFVVIDPVGSWWGLRSKKNGLAGVMATCHLRRAGGNSGGFKNSLSKLRTAGVIIGRNTERMRLSEELV